MSIMEEIVLVEVLVVDELVEVMEEEEEINQVAILFQLHLLLVLLLQKLTML